ncbi:MAG TPA: FG-GAP-like repeat-containing protein [Candidatus Acidoferrum sp.]|nr:FG-GAP-like repeat-containing protein [Candidatus Acidoferrum sp.]
MSSSTYSCTPIRQLTTALILALSCTAASAAPAISVDTLMDWAERLYAVFFPGHAQTQSTSGYLYRYYPSTGNYVGVAGDGQSVYVLGPLSNNALLHVGQIADFACQVQPSGCRADPSPQKFVADIAGAPLKAPLAAALDIGSSFTMEAWIYLTQPVVHAWIMGKGAPINGGASGVAVSAGLGLGDDGLHLRLQGGDFNLEAPQAIPLRVWTHVAAVLDNGEARLLINGELVGTRKGVSPIAATPTIPFGIGAPFDAAGNFSRSGDPAGLYARQVRVWQTARSAAQLKAAMPEAIPTDSTGLAALWPLDERKGSSARDLGAASLTLSRTLELGTAHSAVLESGPYFLESTSTLPSGVLTDASESTLIDINGDGNPELLVTQVARPTYPATYRKLLAFRNVSGRFVEDTDALIGNVQAINPRRMWIADYNRDGRPDLFIADTGTDTDPYPGTQSRLLVGSASGHLIDETALRLPTADHYTHGVAVADVNGDGAADIFMVNYDGSRLLLNDGSGHFTDASDRVVEARAWGSPASDAAFCDINGDGKPDLVIGGSYYAAGGPSTAAPNRVLMNDGTGHFAPDTRYVLPAKLFGDSGNTTAIVCADVNGDGAADLLLATDQNSLVPGLQFLLNDGHGQFSDATERLNLQFPSTNSWVWAIHVVDINSDGLPDIVLRSVSTDNSANTLSRSILLNRGDGSFVDASEVFVANTNFNLAVGDINGDGLIDLVVTSLQDRVRVFRSLKPINAALFDD